MKHTHIKRPNLKKKKRCNRPFCSDPPTRPSRTKGTPIDVQTYRSLLPSLCRCIETPSRTLSLLWDMIKTIVIEVRLDIEIGKKKKGEGGCFIDYIVVTPPRLT